MKRTWTALLAAIAILAAACQPVATPLATPASPLSLELKAPAPGEAVEASPFLQWVGFPAATHYQVTVLNSQSAVMLAKDTTNTLLRVIPPLQKGTSYSWNVQAQDANHAVLAELNSQFSVKADLGLVWPPAGEAVDATPVLQWQSYSGAVQYQVVIWTTKPIRRRRSWIRWSKPPVTPWRPPLKPGSYKWTVQALDAQQVVLAELSSAFSVKARLEVLEPATAARSARHPPCAGRHLRTSSSIR